ncbi:hypothetical protein ACJMK2_029009 [Sinanodonta woodiana]|uniref:Uncharacterized protein n=1 Tax=Sinanodonta woodiana TaxID=1069815 RepID=A0ABD3X8V9_SINWO
MNNRLKVLLNWQPRKTNKLIEKIYELIKVQLTDIRRSLYGTGNYMLNAKFSRSKINKLSWSSKSEEEKHDIFMTFMMKSHLKFTTAVTSLDGMYTVLNAQNWQEKPNQKTRCRATRTRRKN